jgi:hypothetical protein
LTAPSMRRGDRGLAKISPIIIPAFICAAGIAFWFIAAPDPRFGHGFLFSFVLLFFCQGAISSQLLQKLTKFLSQHAAYLSVAGLAAGCFILILSVIGDIVAAGTWSLAS